MRQYSKDELKQSGIYAIINTQTQQAYVGRARIFRDRFWRHVGALNAGNHPNRLLQEDWSCFGAASFEFRILEVVPRYPSDTMKQRECAYMYTYPCLYNLKMPAERWHLGTEDVNDILRRTRGEGENQS